MSELHDRLTNLREEAQHHLQEAADTEVLRSWHRTYLGRKGALTAVLRKLGTLSPDERPLVGKTANKVKHALEAAYETRTEALRREELEQSLHAEALDVTLPGRPVGPGHLHLVTQTARQMYAILAGMGFQVYTGPEVELDEFNFTLLNMPPHHPARDMHDTFWVDNHLVLRTHTSPNQVRVMRKRQPPFRVIVPGKCYRVDFDPSHNWMFHQIEGFAVGEHVSLTDLKGTIVALLRHMFGAGRRVRLRGSYFPFTEPSIEADLECTVCDGAGCGLCKGTGWLEVVPGGMVHPQVLRNSGIDADRYVGFAFGAGLDRLAALKFGVYDIRYFYQNDLRFLRQF
jgi:phenylalanyl-tRNA synthetase alpha chain